MSPLPWASLFLLHEPALLNVWGDLELEVRYVVLVNPRPKPLLSNPRASHQLATPRYGNISSKGLGRNVRAQSDGDAHYRAPS